MNCEQFYSLVVTNPFTPNPDYWWQADTIAGLADGEVICGTSPSGIDWQSDGTNTNHFGGNSDATHPVFKTNIQNGLPVVRWAGSNGTDLRIQNVGATPGTNNQFTGFWSSLSQINFFIVACCRNTSSSNVNMVDVEVGATTVLKIAWDDSFLTRHQFCVAGRRVTGDSLTRLSTGIAVVQDVFNVIAVSIDFSTAKVTMSVDGTVGINNATFATTGSTGSVSSTFRIPNLNSTNGDCDIGEIMVVTSALSPTDVTNYINYLRSKWGTA